MPRWMSWRKAQVWQGRGSTGYPSRNWLRWQKTEAAEGLQFRILHDGLCGEPAGDGQVECKVLKKDAAKIKLDEDGNHPTSRAVASINWTAREGRPVHPHQPRSYQESFLSLQWQMHWHATRSSPC